MADKTKIEWSDATWNPVTGCTEVSPGCDHCYAKTFAERWRGTPGHPYENGFDLTLRPERMDQPLRSRRPRRIFVNSMSDLFHEGVPDDFIVRVFAVMLLAQRHTFQILTKRHGRLRSLLNADWFMPFVAAAACEINGESCVLPPWPLPNVWLGVSVEDQKRADLRIPALLDTPASVRWISAEPLLGPVDLGAAALRPYERQQGGYWLYEQGKVDVHGNGKNWVAAPPSQLDWVVVGGESGPGARPMHPAWARAIRDQCQAAGVPFLFKQWGEHAPEGPASVRPVTVAVDGTVYLPGELAYPDGSRYGEAIRAGHDRAHLTAMYRLGKGRAGRELDGRTWDEYPDSAEARADVRARPGGTTDGAR